LGIELRPFSWQRMIDAVEAVRERARRATAALGDAGIPYAVAGGNAVAAWVARVDRTAVRNTQDVDIIVCRSDFARVKTASNPWVSDTTSQWASIVSLMVPMVCHGTRSD
jgi:hypothetical protein